MGAPVTIDNDKFDDYLETGVAYHTSGNDYFSCENQRREQSWVSSLGLMIFGVIQIDKYYDVYKSVVEKRKDLNQKIYDCAKREHDHWSENIHPHTLESFDYVYNLPEVVPNYDDPLADMEAQGIYDGAVSFINKQDDCNRCDDACDNRLQAEYVLAQTGAATHLTRNQEKRAAIRRALKLQGMAATDRAGKNLGAPGRQALGVALNITNTLVAMSASQLNAGLNMFGSGLTGFGTAFNGVNNG